MLVGIEVDLSVGISKVLVYYVEQAFVYYVFAESELFADFCKLSALLSLLFSRGRISFDIRYVFFRQSQVGHA